MDSPLFLRKFVNNNRFLRNIERALDHSIERRYRVRTSQLFETGNLLISFVHIVLSYFLLYVLRTGKQLKKTVERGEENVKRRLVISSH